jgi:DNA repair protein RadD
MIQLRPRQIAVRDAVREAMRTNQSVLMQAPCAFGKTVVLSDIVARAYEKGKRVIFGVHRKELIWQTAATFDKFGFPYSYIAAGRPHDPMARIWIASLPTLRNRLAQAPDIDLLLIDEAHLSMADGWARVIAHYRANGAYLLGCSASPQRLDGKGLGGNFEALILGPSVAELTAAGEICGYRLFAPHEPDVSRLHILAGDYRKDEAAALMMGKPSITGDAVSHWLKIAKDKRTMAYCVSIEHSKSVAEAFRARGIPALHVDGETDDSVRGGVMRDVAEGKIAVVTNCQLFTEGIDLGALAGRDVTVECIINLRPTQSVALWTQICGRAFRRKAEPAIILDHAGTSLRLGLPDEPRQWSLAGQDRSKSEKSAPAPRVCPSCWAASPARSTVCRECGAPFPVESRQVDERDGELREVTPTDWNAYEKYEAERRAKGARTWEQARADTLEALEALGRARGYKPGWARRIWEARQAKRA